MPLKIKQHTEYCWKEYSLLNLNDIENLNEEHFLIMTANNGYKHVNICKQFEKENLDKTPVVDEGTDWVRNYYCTRK